MVRVEQRSLNGHAKAQIHEIIVRSGASEDEPSSVHPVQLEYLIDGQFSRSAKIN